MLIPATHDLRCERSTAKRCRCTCRGSQHGAAAGEVGTFTDEQAPGVLGEGSGSLLDLLDEPVLEVAR
jgi:hypothetical protein